MFLLHRLIAHNETMVTGMRHGFILVIVLVFAVGCGQQSETRELSLAHFLSTGHVLNDGMFTPLSHQLERLSEGKLTVRQYPAGALNSSAPAQYSILLSGVSDIALVVPAYTADLFPKTDLISFPGVCKTAIECAEALQRARLVLEEEYEAKVLGLWSNDAPILLTRDKPVRALEDMHGLKIRVSTRSAIPFIEALGASAIMQSGTVLHQSLTTGVIDGVAVSPSGIEAFQLHEPTNYLTTWLPLSGLPFALLMNQEVYEALSLEEQGWIDEVADHSFSMAGAEAFDRSGADGLRMAREAGVHFIDLSEGEKRRFNEAIAPIHDARLSQRVGNITVAEILGLFSAEQ
ncbi:MAG: TRAP transporter substrate-binding protein [Rhodothermaceae bacterium]|nr:TRAP transporter substrate-binding protein [Rhodothermaceae bacterium]MYD19324.1 TRAP transporter substrate-binding protein [Rhodothermaceae bacterium]MYI43148.1 TRAP transporter substrate-binding protein [Rhodothermaceae bacterium]